jgi:hypothetical protein
MYKKKSIFIFLRNFGLGHEWTEQGPYLERFVVVLCLSITGRPRRKKLPGVVLKIFVRDPLVTDRHNTTINFSK